VNDGGLYEKARKRFGPDEAMLVKPYMMAEDFSNYQRRIPGLYTFIGIGEGEDTPPLHASCFEFNEQALLNGVEYFLRVTDFE
ncbi:MAG: amidohydrolase, partial [Christensenella sp.]|nr:amidohydrolase [Christensenella sp.]